MKKYIKIIEISKGIYQIEAGRRAIVIPAKSRQEALKKACRYLSINYNEIITKSSLKA